jgi:hypothetical protein
VQALSVIFRAKLHDGLQAAGKLEKVPPKAWQQKWVVHAQHAGSGQKVLDYLGRYVFRTAITQSRLESLQDGQVTFRYRDNRTQQIERVRLPAPDFVQRFLQHVLPKGLAKVRHYGLDSAACRQRHVAALALLQAMALLQNTSAPLPVANAQPLSPSPLSSEAASVLRCPRCGASRLVWLGRVLPVKKIPP